MANKRRAVIAIVCYEGKYLIGRKRADSSKFLAGQWHIIGENLEDGESDISALVRGIQEEAGINISVGKYLAAGITPTGKGAHWYECFAQSNELRIGSDLEDARWVTRDELLKFCEERITSWPQEIHSYFNINL